VRTSHGFLAAIAASVILLAACSPSTPSGSASPTGGETTAAACVPVAGDQLVVLADDLHLQTVDNIIPAVNGDSAKDPAILATLDAVSAALTTAKLVDLNKATDVDFASSANAASAFVSSEAVKSPRKGTGSLTVGAANFSENITVAEIYAAVLRDAGYTVDVRTIGNRETYMPALISGEVDIVPEYAGTVTEFLNKQINGADAAPLASGDLNATVASLATLASQKGLTFGTPSEAQDQNAFAVTKAFADAHGVATLSDLAKSCGAIVLGGPAECPDRPFCQPGLESTYGLKFAEFQSLDAGGPLTKAAIRKGDVVLGLVFSSDGTLG
jgi:osmoprotectant transport system substrate-binding protein